MENKIQESIQKGVEWLKANKGYKNNSNGKWTYWDGTFFIEQPSSDNDWKWNMTITFPKMSDEDSQMIYDIERVTDEDFNKAMEKAMDIFDKGLNSIINDQLSSRKNVFGNFDKDNPFKMEQH